MVWLAEPLQPWVVGSVDVVALTAVTVQPACPCAALTVSEPLASATSGTPCTGALLMPVLGELLAALGCRPRHVSGTKKREPR